MVYLCIMYVMEGVAHGYHHHVSPSAYLTQHTYGGKYGNIHVETGGKTSGNIAANMGLTGEEGKTCCPGGGGCASLII